MLTMDLSLYVPKIFKTRVDSGDGVTGAVMAVMAVVVKFSPVTK